MTALTIAHVSDLHFGRDVSLTQVEALEAQLPELEPDAIVRLEPGRVVLLDQRRLPDEEVELVCRSAGEVAEAIRTLAVRGAPAIGVAAAYGYALAAARSIRMRAL